MSELITMFAWVMHFLQAVLVAWLIVMFIALCFVAFIVVGVLRFVRGIGRE
jgi:hypothetical protein